MLIGAEFDASRRTRASSSFDALRSYSLQDHAASCRSCATCGSCATWAGICDISADFSPIMGATGVDGFLVTTGWGTWGFKAIPAGGEAHGRAHRDRPDAGS